MKEDVQKMHNEIETEETFALECLRETARDKKRWFIAFLITLTILFLTNAGWLIRENQYETIVEGETTTIDGGNGMTTYLENSNSGDISYGENN